MLESKSDIRISRSIRISSSKCSIWDINRERRLSSFKIMWKISVPLLIICLWKEISRLEGPVRWTFVRIASKQSQLLRFFHLIKRDTNHLIWEALLPTRNHKFSKELITEIACPNSNIVMIPISLSRIAFLWRKTAASKVLTQRVKGACKVF